MTGARAGVFDPTLLNQAIAVLESLHRHRMEHPLSKSDELYYELLVRYFRDIRDARPLGKPLVYHTDILPVEICYAMDIVPALLESAGMLANMTGHWEEALAVAKAYGLPPEACSSQRQFLGAFLAGWAPPPDTVIWNPMACDHNARAGDLLVSFFDCPGLLVDFSYRFEDRDLIYFVGELEGMVAFLERLTGRKMDWDRLVQSVEYSRQFMILQREIGELRKAVPTPLRGRVGLFMHFISIFFQGTPEGVTFLRQLRDEAKARVAQGEGGNKEEKYRLLMYYEPPAYAWKILDWMERAHGAVMVFEPALNQWGPGDFDPRKPLEALARKTFMRPTYRQFQGSIKPLVEDMVQAAKEYNADGVLSFCHVGCRNSSPCNRLLKDKIMAEAGLPFFAVEDDLVDEAFASPEEIKDKIEGFLEIIDERRG